MNNVDIVNAVLKKYNSLSKGGKPIQHETKAEWTVLASIVMGKYTYCYLSSADLYFCSQ